MIKRSLYYWSKLYEEQLNEGEDYSQLKRTVCINILNFKYLKNDRFHNAYRLKEAVVLCQYLGHKKSNFFMLHF